jgi:hypothetical protein
MTKRPAPSKARPSKPTRPSLPEHVIARVKALGFYDVETWDEQHLRGVLACMQDELARRETH